MWNVDELSSKVGVGLNTAVGAQTIRVRLTFTTSVNYTTPINTLR